MKYNPGPTPTRIEGVVEFLGRELARIATAINGPEFSGSWDPGLIAVNSYEETAIPAVGVELGDVAVASFSKDITGMTISAAVTAADEVTVTLLNHTAGAVNLSAGMVTVRIV